MLKLYLFKIYLSGSERRFVAVLAKSMRVAERLAANGAKIDKDDMQLINSCVAVENEYIMCDQDV